MRVIHVIKATGVAGAERHLLDLLPGLRARGCDARLCVLVEPKKPVAELFEQARRSGLPISSLPIHGHADASVCLRLARRFRRERPDIVHTHLMHADLYGIMAARLSHVPVAIMTRHDDLPFRRRFVLRQLNRWLWTRVDAGVAVSQAILRFSQEVEGATIPIRVIHHGLAQVEPEAAGPIRAAFGLEPDALVVGIVCRLMAQKGVTHGIAAFAMIASSFPSAMLFVAGDGPDRPKLEREVRARGLGERVRFLGWRADSGRILSALDLLMAPSLSEGFGLAALEAMARGVPVLATRAGAIPEVVVDGETGLLVPPADVEALSAGLTRLLSDPMLRARLGAAGVERARQQFSLARMVDATLELYEKPLRQRAARG
jgi:glycosyltransferase involved in cell wall biosynthesis